MNRKIEKKQIYVLLFFAVCTFTFLLSSPLNPFGSSEASWDSGVFRTIAMMMGKGYVPYKDTFDHKGPVLYLINYFGSVISFEHGVWWIEFLSLFITSVALFYIARLINKSYLQSIAAVLISMSLLYQYFQGGNLTEEFALPFISVSLYIFLDYVFNSHISNKRLVVCGFCFGCVALLRPNMIGLWIIYCLAIFIDTIAKKDYPLTLRFILWFVLGTSLIVVPVLVWLYSKDALPDFWFAYITFNGAYSSSTGISGVLKAALYFLSTPVFITALTATIVSLFICKAYRKNVSVYLAYMIINLPLVAMSGQIFGHYGMILVPSMVFPLAALFKYLSKKKIILWILISALSAVTILKPSLRLAGTCIRAVRNPAEISEITAGIVDIIKENTDENDKISVYGNDDIFYLLSDRAHATRYSYQFPIGNSYKPIMDEYWEQMEMEQPKIIVIQPWYNNEIIQAFLSENEYEMIYVENSEALNECYSVYLKK